MESFPYILLLVALLIIATVFEIKKINKKNWQSFQAWYSVRMIQLVLAKICRIQIEGINPRDYPDFCDAYISDAWIEVETSEMTSTYLPSGQMDGKNLRQLSEAELDWLNEQDFRGEVVQKYAIESLAAQAESASEGER